jgi:hypothetical protein
MKTSPRFQVGDRVRTVQPLVALPLGSGGTIEQVARAGKLYSVLFDGEAALRLMHHDYLEPEGFQEQTVGKHDD